ncbi:LYR motif-containing protein 4 isoform X2 [Canis lupus familiaris]|uniref:LYR motif-containing protein 4 isoform X2 n=1 Tax=Canis lupus familiaris TaxID=9615 RepID=UPI0015F144CC|nr:LYR motif-containing protein 4 isoform X2 [Canis lupus familiaris]
MGYGHDCACGVYPVKYSWLSRPFCPLSGHCGMTLRMQDKDEAKTNGSKVLRRTFIDWIFLCSQFCAKYQSYIIKVNPPSSPERTYAVRRIRDAFRENKNVKDPAEIQALVNKAKRDLGIIRRQLRILDFPLEPGSERSPKNQPALG